MRRFSGFLFTALLVGCCAAAHAGPALVADGGSLTIEGKTVRLWGMEAPAGGQVCKTSAGKEWACGDRARQQLAAVATGEDISCEPKGDGVAICRAAGLDLGLLLVKEGLAWSRGGYDDIEARAREAKVGIWE